jgi:hypothetical protein
VYIHVIKESSYLPMVSFISLIKKIPWINKHILMLSASLIAVFLFVLMIVFPSIYIFFDTVLALLVANTYLYAHLKDRRLNSQGIRTMGIVADKEEEHGVTSGSDADAYDAYFVTYTFTPPLGHELEARHKIPESLYKELFIGGPINISFDSKDSSRNVPVGGIQPLWFRITNTVVIALFTFVAAALLLFIIRRA